MDMIQRTLTRTITSQLRPGFMNLIYGPRRVGKTVLLKQIADSIQKPGVWFDGDHQETRDALSNTSQTALKQLVAQSDAVFVDEAQRISNIGLSLKILIDTFPEKLFFVTGSSSLSLARGIQESLTGRHMTYKLYPLSTEELTMGLSMHQVPPLLESQLLFGGYPYVQQLANPKEKQDYLTTIVDDYLFRDILGLKDISNPEHLKRLTTLLAFQIGSEVSYNELAKSLTLDVKTVIRYLSFLKQSFVIFELGSYAKNLRNEVAKSKKYYFWDLGIRNAAISQFQTLDVRTDRGSLWENFLAIERMKKQEYQGIHPAYYFWRTYDGAEIDWLEEAEGHLHAYEFKWQSSKRKTPKLFRETYGVDVSLISQENYQDFLSSSRNS